MLTTNDEGIANHLDMLRNHGGSISEEQRHHGAKPYLLAAYDIVGYNYRMTDLQGAVGFVQLKTSKGLLKKEINGPNIILNNLQILHGCGHPSFRKDTNTDGRVM